MAAAHCIGSFGQSNAHSSPTGSRCVSVDLASRSDSTPDCSAEAKEPGSPSYRKRGEFRGAAYDPTPEEIQQACIQIQAEWSPAERMLRAGQFERVWNGFHYQSRPIVVSVPTVRLHTRESH